MRIGVLSDTHVYNLSHEIIEKLKNINLDLIIHCGDYTDINVVHQLQALGNFCGVAGNMDSSEIKTVLKEKEIMDVEGKRIGIYHGHGSFFLDKMLKKRFSGEKIDIYLHGHTHRLRMEKKNEIYYLNPGRFPSMIIIDIQQDREIVVEAIDAIRQLIPHLSRSGERQDLEESNSWLDTRKLKSVKLKIVGS